MNQDLEGKVDGGELPASAVSAEWRLTKSEYRFCTVKERRGKRNVMLYRV